MRGILFSAFAIGAAALPIDRDTTKTPSNGNHTPQRVVWDEASSRLILTDVLPGHENDEPIFRLHNDLHGFGVKGTAIKVPGTTINDLQEKVRGLLIILASILLLTTCQERDQTLRARAQRHLCSYGLLCSG